MTKSETARGNWADMSERPSRKAHTRSTCAKHSRFLKRYEAGKISWGGTYIGYPSDTDTAVAVADPISNPSATNTSATVGDRGETATGESDVVETCVTSASVDGVSIIASACVEEGPSFTFERIDFLANENQRLTSENEKLFVENKHLAASVADMEHTIQYLDSLALNMHSGRPQFCDATVFAAESMDEARIAALERAVSDLSVQFCEVSNKGDNHQRQMLDSISEALVAHQQKNQDAINTLVGSLRCSVEKSLQRLQVQIDSLSVQSDSLDAWNNGGGDLILHTIDVTTSEVLLHTSAFISVVDDDAVAELQAVTQDIPGCSRLPTSETESALFGGSKLVLGPCLQIKSRFLGNQGLGTDSITVDAGILDWTISEFLATSALIKQLRPHLQQEVPVLAICDIDRSVVQLPPSGSVSTAAQLSAEELGVMQMTDAEFHNKMRDDQDVLRSLYGDAFFGSDNVDEHEESCQIESAPLSEECYQDAPAPLSIGARVTLQKLNTTLLIGLTGIVSSDLCNGRQAVLLEDGTTRQFTPDKLLASALKPTKLISSATSSQLREFGPDHK